MKKKILLAVLMVAMLVCLFAISVGASDLAYDRVYTIDGTEYPLWEQDAEGNYHPLMWYQDGDKLSKVYADNTDSTKAPYVTYTKYVDNSTKEIKTVTITDANGKTFGGKETVVIANLHNIYLKDGDKSQITLMNKSAFQGSTVLKAIYIPESIKTMGYSGSNGNFVPFQGCTALEYVEIAPSATITTIGPNTFYQCTALKAISLPNSIKNIDKIAFRECTSLEAVYLPSNLEQLLSENVGSANRWQRGPFYNCSSLYFVNEPFTVNNIATDIPAKPEVYYFPAGLTEIGEALRNCSNMNNVIVFGDKITEHSTTMYYGYAKDKNEVKTVVYLGNMTKFSHTENLSCKINFILPNTTTPQADFTATTAYKTYYGSALYFCKLGLKCELSYGVVKWTEETSHFVDVRKSEVVGATCTTNETATTYCFCGAKVSEGEVENTKLGHEFDVTDGATKVSIAYANYLANGTLNIKCARCDECDEAEVAPIITEFKGFSVKEDGEGITFGYSFNNEAIKEFEAVNGGKVELGFVVAVKALLGDNAPLNASGEKASDKVVKASVDSGEFTAADFVLRGTWEGNATVNGEEIDIKKVEFYMAGYLTVNGTTVYLNANGSSANADAVTFEKASTPEVTE